ncbi:MAG: Ig-like domain-containing protein [Gammaproteobacteria bacterium]|nr:Ig-like domain-containing protein [Gammaproteobacteria bacterium]
MLNKILGKITKQSNMGFSPRWVLVTIALALGSSAANAAINITFEQLNPTTVSVKHNGAINLGALSSVGTVPDAGGFVISTLPSTVSIELGTGGARGAVVYDAPIKSRVLPFSGSAFASASSSTGDTFGFSVTSATDIRFGLPNPLPNGYVSGTTISGESQFAGTLADLKLKAGIFGISFGVGVGSEVFTFDVPGNTIGGTITGLASTVALQLNSGEILVLGNGTNVPTGGTGPFTFTAKAVYGEAYSVSVLAEPMGQTCTVVNGSGTMQSADITNIQVSCVSRPYTVGGQVSGLVAGESVVLQNNGGDNLTVVANGAFTFSTPVPASDPYNVTVLTQPGGSVSETCLVTNGSGSASTVSVTNVNVVCTPNSFTVGGSVSGLGSDAVSLQVNGADTISVFQDGTFNFSPIGDGSPYIVTVSFDPFGQTCTVGNAGGTLSGADVTNVAVTCTNIPYTVGGLLSGLAAGDSVELELLRNTVAFGNLTLSADGAFTFPAAASLVIGDDYLVRVKTLPSSPSEQCTVTNGSGTIDTFNISNVSVTCVVDTFPIEGTITGLASGGSVTVTLNGADAQTRTGNGPFAFSPLADGSDYVVAVSSQPVGQTCSVANGSGKLAGSAVTNVAVSCVDNQYNIGGLLSGLAAGETVVLQNNAGDDLTLSADGAFAFTTPIDFGDPYDVKVLNQPAGAVTETCKVSQGTGTTPDTDVTNISVVCTPNSYSVGGSVTGLIAGASVTLQNNGADNRTVTADGTFVFSPLADGVAYAVTVATQPPGQTCTVSPEGTGTLAGAAVTNVSVSCSRDVSATLSSISVGASSVTAGGSTSLTVVVRDTGGNPVSGLPVSLVVDSASVDASAVSILRSPTTTNASGEAVFTVASSVAQAVRFQASFNPDLFISVTWTSAAIPAVPAQPVPALSTWMLVLLGLILAGFASGSLTQRRTRV